MKIGTTRYLLKGKGGDVSSGVKFQYFYDIINCVNNEFFSNFRIAWYHFIDSIHILMFPFPLTLQELNPNMSFLHTQNSSISLQENIFSYPHMLSFLGSRKPFGNVSTNFPYGTEG